MRSGDVYIQVFEIQKTMENAYRKFVDLPSYKMVMFYIVMSNYQRVFERPLFVGDIGGTLGWALRHDLKSRNLE